MAPHAPRALKRSKPTERPSRRTIAGPHGRGRVADIGVLVFATLVFLVAATLGAHRRAERPVRRAVLVDELAVFEPHSAFVRAIEGSLTAGGYRMTYVPSPEVTVERLRRLPGDRADLIILRAHAALIFDKGRWTEDAALFSSEPVDLANFDVSGLRALDPSGLSGQEAPSGSTVATAPVGASRLSPSAAAALVPVRRAVGADRRPYLGLGARFVRDHLRGRFRDDPVVVLMGCDTLRGRGLSEAFLARGARAVIGWNGEVSAAHTDRSTAALIAHYSVNGDVSAALRAVSTNVGPDPVSGAYLVAAVR